MSARTPTSTRLITVVHTGVPRTLSVEPEEQVKDVLARALDLFSWHNMRHLYSMFFASGEVVFEDRTAAAAGLDDGVTVWLKPNVVRG